MELNLTYKKIIPEEELENGIFVIRNTVDEWHSAKRGFFKTLEEAREAITKCCDWFRDYGTGEIWFYKFSLWEKNYRVLVEKYG